MSEQTPDSVPAEEAPGAPGDLPPEVLLILGELQAEFERSQAPLSLARLSKRTQLRMSTLRRFLSALEEAGVVRVELNEDGTGSAVLVV
jgi:DNA-binding transcriptional ArsR family regulator